MDDAEDVARRFFALWGEYLNALAAEPQTLDLWRRWLSAGTAVPGERRSAGPPASAAAAAGASGERDAAVAELARRIDELERRLAALEPVKPRRRPAATAGRRTRGARAGKR